MRGTMGAEAFGIGVESLCCECGASGCENAEGDVYVDGTRGEDRVLLEDGEGVYSEGTDVCLSNRQCV